MVISCLTEVAESGDTVGEAARVIVPLQCRGSKGKERRGEKWKDGEQKGEERRDTKVEGIEFGRR
jgi:hypothetical protein